MNKILVTFGTRPEAIKMGPLCNSLIKDRDFEVQVCVTGQHRQMLDQVTDLFDIKPDFDLDVMSAGQSLEGLTSKLLSKFTKVLKEVKPDIVLVHGDTTTAFAASLSSFYEGIDVGHIEAGLRTNNLNFPFPEEFNRQAIGKLATYHFAPTELNKLSLMKENVNEKNIIVTGNTVIDSLFWVLEKIENDTEIRDDIISKLSSQLNIDVEKEKFILITGHRRENFGPGIESICSAIRELSLTNKNIKFIYPLHLNPKIKIPVKEILGEIDNVLLIEPLSYLPFVYLIRNCFLVLTDSGGIQEEAPSLGKPVLVMRNETERPEGVEAGTVRLVGSNSHDIVHAVTSLINDTDSYMKMKKLHNPYGDGKATEKIVKFLKGLKDV